MVKRRTRMVTICCLKTASAIDIAKMSQRRAVQTWRQNRAPTNGRPWERGSSIGKDGLERKSGRPMASWGVGGGMGEAVKGGKILRVKPGKGGGGGSRSRGLGSGNQESQ